MAMTLRPDPDDEAALTRLARRWGLSKQQAALRAIREAASAAEVLELSDQLATEDEDALHRLGTL